MDTSTPIIIQLMYYNTYEICFLFDKLDIKSKHQRYIFEKFQILFKFQT